MPRRARACYIASDEDRLLTAVILSIATFFSTSLGGLFGLRNRSYLHLIMGFTAGVLVGLVAFDLLPEIYREIAAQHVAAIGPMVAMIAGFLIFHVAEKTVWSTRDMRATTRITRTPRSGTSPLLPSPATVFWTAWGSVSGSKSARPQAWQWPSRSLRTISPMDSIP